jgi:multiple sugar transport system ATP-binding protein
LATVEIRNVRKAFGPVEVLHGASVDIADGEFVVLVGPSGCGKSTLLRMLAGLENITSGEISISGRVVNSVPPKDRDIAMVFQNYALYPHMTVYENMGFSLKLAKAPKTLMDSAIERSAKILGLEQLLARFPRQLSGGQRQRVAMGRAIVRNPQVFLFDEPLSNLDAKLRVQMRSEIKELHQRLKVTTVYVTHDQIEAMTMADKIVVMNGGNIEQAGPPLELYDRPANLFVAGFIGSPAMNLLKGVIDGQVFRTDDGTEWPLPKGAGHANPGPAVYGVRPEHLSLGASTGGSTSGSTGTNTGGSNGVNTGGDGIAATVQVIEPTGSETQVLMKVGSQSLIGAFRERVSVKPGEILRIRPDPELVHLFDQQSGKRL